MILLKRARHLIIYFYNVGEIQEYINLIEDMDYDELLETKKINEDIEKLEKILTRTINK